jgi:hypothetical protein
MFNFETEAPAITDADLAVSIALAEEREEAISASLAAEEDDGWLRDLAECQQDLRWATKG